MPTQTEPEDRIALLQGALDLLSLKALVLGPYHGQGKARSIQQQSEEVFSSTMLRFTWPCSDLRTGSASGEVVRDQEQPQGAVLFTDLKGPGAAGRKDERVGEADAGDGTDPGQRRRDGTEEA